MFWKYLKSRWKIPCIMAVFLAVEALIFSLYRLPAQAVLYAGAVCAFFGMIAAVSDYGRFYVKHKRLEQLRSELAVSVEHLPIPSGLLETDYQEIIRELFAQNRASREEMEAHFRDTVEYYTVWAHQIKTPIAAMRLLLGETDFPEKQELLEELQRIEEYVGMVMCYLRLDTESSDYVIKECDLDKILHQVIKKHASSFIRKRIRLDYKETGLRVVTDEKWLFFVIDQIFSNALKYTPSGCVSVSVETPKTLCICDTGIGIAPEDLPLIFERGYTGMTGRQDKRASGIGLYLCRRVCTNLGHRITVTSAPEEGTQVRLDLKNAGLEPE